MRLAKQHWTELNSRIQYCDSEAECAQQADAIVLMTEWEQFRTSNWEKIVRSMRGNVFFDMRNMFAEDSAVRQWFQYYPVGSSEYGYPLQEAQ
jgi:UDPglucose 6-dehydrogenase